MSPVAFLFNRMHVLRFAVVMALLCPLSLFVNVSALEMGPGMFMVQDVPPGREVNLHKIGGVRFTIYNRSNKALDYTLTCHRPGKGGLATWEQGYEEIPKAEWCYLEEAVFTVPANSEKQVGLIINIPDEPENYNRKFMLAVILNTGRNPGTSIGLAVACRVQIETAINDDMAGAKAAPVAVVPGTIHVHGKPGDQISGSVMVRNNTGATLAASVERLQQIYTDPIKYPRYFSNGYVPQLTAWFAPQGAEFALAAGAHQQVHFTGVIPASAELGKDYEELAFIRGKTPEGKDILTFVRLHCHIGDKEKTPSDKEKKDDQ